MGRRGSDDEDAVVVGGWGHFLEFFLPARISLKQGLVNVRNANFKENLLY